MKSARVFPAELRKCFTTASLRWLYIATLVASVAISATAGFLFWQTQPSQIDIPIMVDALRIPVSIFGPVLGIALMLSARESKEDTAFLLLKPFRAAHVFSKIFASILMEVLLLALTIGLTLGVGILLGVLLHVAPGIHLSIFINSALSIAAAGMVGLLIGDALSLAIGSPLAVAVIAISQPLVLNSALNLIPDGWGRWLRSSSINEVIDGANHVEGIFSAIIWIFIPLIIGLIRNRRDITS